jgi:hypothetical protein
MRRSLAALPLTVLVLMSTAGIALADLGTAPSPIVVCVGETQVVTVTSDIDRHPSGPQFPDSATITFVSLTGVVPPLSATVSPGPIVDGTVVLPANWTSLPIFTAAADTFSFNLTVTGTSFTAHPFPAIVLWDISINGGPTQSFTSDISIQTNDCTPPTVTINQAAAQADPTGSSPILFDVVFSEPVTGFTAADVALSGTAGATTAIVTGTGPSYEVAVSGMTANGTVIATIPAGAVDDAGSNGNGASTSTDNTVTYAAPPPDTEPPTVTVNQAAAQSDPTGSSPILFDVVFSEPVTGFTATDVLLAGTAGATTALVTGSGPTYQVAVGGMTANGTVIATIPAGAALDAGSNPNDASTSTDNTVTFAVGAPPPTAVPNDLPAPDTDTAEPADVSGQVPAFPLFLLAVVALTVTLLVVPRRRPR